MIRCFIFSSFIFSIISLRKWSILIINHHLITICYPNVMFVLWKWCFRSRVEIFAWGKENYMKIYLNKTLKLVFFSLQSLKSRPSFFTWKSCDINLIRKMLNCMIWNLCICKSLSCSISHHAFEVFIFVIRVQLPWKFDQIIQNWDL